MPRSSAISVENNFTKGLITEFTAMNFPENAVTDGDNVVFSEMGSVTRRLGMDFESQAQVHLLSSITSTANCFVEFKWSSVANDGTKTFLVEQVGNQIVFFENSGVSISSGKKSFTVNMNLFATPGTTEAEVASNPCQFTSGKGYLFIVHPYCDPIYVEYNSGSDTITVREILIEIRDFEGVDDGLENDTRPPPTISNLHHYNLFNQGWYVQANVYVGGDVGTVMNVLSAWQSLRGGESPSNADIWWVYKGSTEWAYFGTEVSDFTIAKGLVGPEQFTLGNTPAPKGHYIYDAFNVNRTAKTGIAGLPSESSQQARPSCVAFYAGRVFYAGTSQDGYSDKVYFSQIIESDTQFGRCYQVNDPTSESQFDLLDSDGGVVLLPTIEKVVALKVINEALVVIGTNGIFVIRGTENGPFKATDYTVEFVNPTGGLSNLSVVDIEAGIAFWNNNGIYVVSPDNIGVFFKAENISKQTIQSLVDSVSPANKGYVKGAYNTRTKTAQWLFSDDIDAPPFTYNRILEFNIVSQAFYTHTIDQTLSPRIRGIVSISGFKETIFEDEVTDNLGVDVTDLLGEIVTVDQSIFVPNTELFKYTTTGDISSGSPGITYSELLDDGYIDWFSVNSVGAPYESFFISGYRIRGEFLRSFNSTPIAIILRNFPEAGLIFNGIWDYGWRHTTSQQLYLTRPEVEYIVRRIKLRGKGKALQLRYTSEGNKPFEVVGWSTLDSGGQQP